MKKELSKIAQNLEQGTITDNEALTLLLGLLGVSGSLLCWVKDTVEGEKILIRESQNGLKYLIFDDELISYGRVGKKIGDSETIHFDGTNGLSVIRAWSNDH